MPCGWTPGNDSSASRNRPIPAASTPWAAGALVGRGVVTVRTLAGASCASGGRGRLASARDPALRGAGDRRRDGDRLVRLPFLRLLRPAAGHRGAAAPHAVLDPAVH